MRVIQMRPITVIITIDICSLWRWIISIYHHHHHQRINQYGYQTYIQARYHYDRKSNLFFVNVCLFVCFQYFFFPNWFKSSHCCCCFALSKYQVAIDCFSLDLSILFRFVSSHWYLPRLIWFDCIQLNLIQFNSCVFFFVFFCVVDCDFVVYKHKLIVCLFSLSVSLIIISIIIVLYDDNHHVVLWVVHFYIHICYSVFMYH